VNVLVTGAAGFIGRHVARFHLERGDEVCGIDNFMTSHRRDLDRSGLATMGFEFVDGDVRATDFVPAYGGRRFDSIYHLACPTGVPNLEPLALDMLGTSYEGTRNVLELARTCGARVVVASSAEVYGNPLVSPQGEAYNGNVDTLGPRNGYEEGKRVAEALASIYSRRFGVPATIARIFNTYGPGMALDETRVIPAFVRRALEGRPLVIHGDGSQTRCHAFVSDIVSGLVLVAERGESGTAYNLGSSTEVTIRELAERIVGATGSTSALQRIARPAHDHDRRLPDTSRARALGWQPSVSLDEGLRATIADVRARLGETVPAGA
jgi:nucleoside-diphosphate-sugar epimerase